MTPDVNQASQPSNKFWKKFEQLSKRMTRVERSLQKAATQFTTESSLDELRFGRFASFQSFPLITAAGVTRWGNQDVTLLFKDRENWLTQDGGAPDFTNFTVPESGSYTLVGRIAYSGLTTGTTVWSTRVMSGGGAEVIIDDDLAARTTRIHTFAYPLILTAGDEVVIGGRTSTAGQVDALRAKLILDGVNP
jgi:hypothetical protein